MQQQAVCLVCSRQAALAKHGTICALLAEWQQSAHHCSHCGAAALVQRMLHPIVFVRQRQKGQRWALQMTTSRAALVMRLTQLQQCSCVEDWQAAVPLPCEKFLTPRRESATRCCVNDACRHVFKSRWHCSWNMKVKARSIGHKAQEQGDCCLWRASANTCIAQREQIHTGVMPCGANRITVTEPTTRTDSCEHCANGRCNLERLRNVAQQMVIDPRLPDGNHLEPRIWLAVHQPELSGGLLLHTPALH